MEEALGGGLPSADDGEAQGSVQLLRGGGDDPFEQGVDALEELSRVDDSLRCDQLGRTELGRELWRAARRDDEVPGEPRDGLARRDSARRHPQDLDIGALVVLLRSQGIHRDDLLAERDLAALLLDLAGDLVGAPLQVVGKLSPGGVERRQGDEGDKSRRAERGEVGEEGVAGLGVAQSGEILKEAVRTTAKKKKRSAA